MKKIKNILMMLFISTFMITPAYAEDDEVFTEFKELIITFMQGDLGMIFAIMMIIGGVLALAYGDSKSAIRSVFVVIALGGIVWIATTTFQIGQGLGN